MPADRCRAARPRAGLGPGDAPLPGNTAHRGPGPRGLASRAQGTQRECRTVAGTRGLPAPRPRRRHVRPPRARSKTPLSAPSWEDVQASALAGSRAPSNPRGNTARQVQTREFRAGRGRLQSVGAWPAHGGGASARRRGRGCRDLLIAGVAARTAPGESAVCACSVHRAARWAAECGRLGSSSPRASGTVAAGGVAARGRRGAVLGCPREPCG